MHILFPSFISPLSSYLSAPFLFLLSGLVYVYLPLPPFLFLPSLLFSQLSSWSFSLSLSLFLSLSLSLCLSFSPYLPLPPYLPSLPPLSGWCSLSGSWLCPCLYLLSFNFYFSCSIAHSSGLAYLVNRSNGTTVLVSQHNGISATVGELAISIDGSAVVFTSTASHLDSFLDDTNGQQDTFHYEVSSGILRRVSLNVIGQELAHQSQNIAVSPNGRYVCFNTYGDVTLEDPHLWV